MPPLARIVGEMETSRTDTGQRGTPQGPLNVTTSLAFATHQLAPVAQVLARHPLVQLEVLPTDRVIDIVDEGIDVASASAGSPIPASWRARSARTNA